MARGVRKTNTGFVKVEGAGAVAEADELLATIDEVTPQVTVPDPEPVPEPVVVQIVEQAPDPEPVISEQTRLEMEEGRRSLERFR